MAGIDKRKDILIESFLLNPTSNAAVITIPALDTPGTIARVCIRPIKIMIAIEQLSIFLLSFLSLSAK